MDTFLQHGGLNRQPFISRAKLINYNIVISSKNAKILGVGRIIDGRGEQRKGENNMEREHQDHYHQMISSSHKQYFINAQCRLDTNIIMAVKGRHRYLVHSHSGFWLIPLDVLIWT